MAPKMDMYEQAIYMYLIRHSRLIEKNEIVVGFKSARKQLAFGIGKAGSPPSERICYEKVRSLDDKGFIKLVGSEHTGTRIQPYLPDEIQNLIPNFEKPSVVSIEEMDFFNISENRQLLLERENHLCFYCQAKLNENNFIVEHVVSRPEGDNSYRNLVAACRQCNNRKGSSDAKAFLRVLYRENFLSAEEFEARLKQIELLINGKLKPRVVS